MQLLTPILDWYWMLFTQVMLLWSSTSMWWLRRKLLTIAFSICQLLTIVFSICQQILHWSWSRFPLPCQMASGCYAKSLLVPMEFRRPVFYALHALSHPGVRASQRLVTWHFVWSGINADVRQWARSCLQCQRSKVHRHNKSPPGTFSTPDERFDKVHIDLVGLFCRMMDSLASERSERDTIRGNSIENRGYSYIYVWTYVRHFCTLTLMFLC